MPGPESATRKIIALSPPCIESTTAPPRGENCRQMMLDNRTGRMWDRGYVNCYEAVSRSDKDQRGGMSTLRMNAIGKAFNRRED